jgi:CheY-like chemotaxis protein
MLTGRTILVAEDEPLIRLDLTAALVGAGAAVWPVANAHEASVSPPHPI